MRELSEIYDAFVDGRPSPLPELKLQYPDYAVWQREYMRGEVLETHLGYWKRQLANAPAELSLPTDRPRPLVQSFRGAIKTFRLTALVAERLTRFCKQRGVTSFMTLLTAFQALLSRYTGQHDIVVGSPVSNRNRMETENLIGFFANTLALRLDLTGNPTFSELIERTRAVALDAYKYQDLPFEKLVQEINPERSMSHNPLFQVLFSLGSFPEEIFRMRGLELRWIGRTDATARFDISLVMRQHADQLSGALEYSTDLFDEPTIDRMLGHFQNLLEAVVENPDLRLAEMPMLSGAERDQLLYEFNATDHEYPRERSLHEFIEQQAERTPEATALIFGPHQLTYRQLNSAANQLAHRLRKMGVGPEVLVAVCAVRSVELVVALLGTLKAGAAYVPIDPEYPRDRLAVMLKDSQPRVLLTLEHLLSVLPENPIPTVCLDRDWRDIADEPIGNPPVLTTGKDQAYVIYTSGSTGMPKGVANLHEGIVNRLLWMQSAYTLNDTDRILQKTPYSFDVSVWEFFWPLMTGACLVVAIPNGHKDPNYLVRTIVEHGITTIHFVPSMLRVFLEAEGIERCISLRRVICSGEALTPDLVKRFFVRLSASLHNLYGPTEAAVDVTFYECSPHSGCWTVPIGKPIWNTQIYILDRRGSPTPIGVPGELHIGGVGLARGYLGRPELTAERFVDDSISGKPGGRLYKTGDLARFLPDGNVEYLGRLDFQVKLRGLRIELAEIETALSQHPAVKECVVIVREDVPGDKRLVAYIVTGGQEPSSGESFRSLLLAQLPDYMIPSAFVSLPALPLTSSGKTDRKALPAPELQRDDKSGYVLPRTPLEEKLVFIWSEVLKLPQIGVNDDFFELGGHSLLAVDLFVRIERQLGQKLPLNLLFNSPTVAQLALHMGPSELSSSETSIKPCRTGGSRPPIFAAHGIGGTVLTFRALAGFLDPDQPIYGLEALSLDQGWTNLEELASHYAHDIRAFQPEGPYHLIGSSFGGMVVFEIARQLRAQGQEVGLVGLLDSSNMGARNLLTYRERIRNHMGFLYKRVLLHLRRFPDRSLSQWPRYAAGRILAVGRRLHGSLWRVAYRSYATAPADKPSILHNMKRAYELAGMDYIPQVYSGKIVLFRRKEKITPQQTQRQHGWTGLATGGLEIIEVPGDHNSIMSEPHVKVLAHELTNWLKRYSSGEMAFQRESPKDPAYSITISVSSQAESLRRDNPL